MLKPAGMLSLAVSKLEPLAQSVLLIDAVFTKVFFEVVRCSGLCIVGINPGAITVGEPMPAAILSRF